jgi:lysylphosphatidylglycerol synthetase-like protein (DUF2156 family)
LEGWIIQINLENYFLRTLVIVVGMSLTMIAVALGIINLFETGLPMSAPLIFLIFAVLFIMGTTFFEGRGAVHPWSLIGGAISSMAVTFIIMCITGGILYAATGGLSTIPFETVVYSISACMIVSMVTLNFAYYKLQYIRV